MAARPAQRKRSPVALRSFSLERAKVIGRQRSETLLRFARLKKRHRAVKAASIVGASIPTLWRWQKQFEARGAAGLLPKNFNSGKRSPFKPLRLTAKDVRELELLTVEKNSSRAAWLRFANSSPACPPLAARYVQRTGKAPAQLAGVGRVSLVQARCYASADGCRLFVKLPCKGTLTARLSIPPGFKLVEPAKSAKKTA